MKQSLQEQLTQELNEMKRLGMHVPDKAFELAKDDWSHDEYAGMSVSELADLIIDMADIAEVP